MLMFVTCLCIHYYTSCHLYRMSSAEELVMESVVGKDNTNVLNMCESNYVCK